MAGLTSMRRRGVDAEPNVIPLIDVLLVLLELRLDLSALRVNHLNSRLLGLQPWVMLPISRVDHLISRVSLVSYSNARIPGVLARRHRR